MLQNAVYLPNWASQRRIDVAVTGSVVQLIIFGRYLYLVPGNRLMSTYGVGRQWLTHEQLKICL